MLKDRQDRGAAAGEACGRDGCKDEWTAWLPGPDGERRFRLFMVEGQGDVPVEVVRAAESMMDHQRVRRLTRPTPGS